MQLKRGEASAKDDESPVTVADYGAQVRCSGWVPLQLRCWAGRRLPPAGGGPGREPGALQAPAAAAAGAAESGGWRRSSALPGTYTRALHLPHSTAAAALPPGAGGLEPAPLVPGPGGEPGG